MSIEVSDVFSSFTEFEEKLLEFKERNFTEVYIYMGLCNNPKSKEKRFKDTV